MIAVLLIGALLLGLIALDLAAWFWGVDSTGAATEPVRGTRAQRNIDPVWSNYPDA